MICSDGIGLGPWDLNYLRIFERLPSGWTEVASMPNVVYPGLNREYFGTSLDVWGDWIAVGCPLFTWDPLSPPGVPGQVYLYRRSAPGVWALYQRIQASNGWFGPASGVPVTDEFGRALDFSEDGRLVVGAPQGKNSSGERFRGGAYVFDFDGTSWVLTAAQIRSTPAFVAIKSRDGVRGNPAMKAATSSIRSPRFVSSAAA